VYHTKSAPSHADVDVEGAHRPDRTATRIELIPIKSVYKHLDDLPAASRLSVTCSPAHGVEATIELVAHLLQHGHDAIPHLAARQFASHAQLRDVVARCDALGVIEAFVIGGDAASDGPFGEAVDVATAYAEHSDRIRRFGFAGYPDDHVLIGTDELWKALGRKQAFLREAGLHGYLTTQMCFDASKITSWLGALRDRGIELPVHLGVPGRVDRFKLASISARLGVGSSLGFLKKNKTSALKLLGSAHYEPTDLIEAVIGDHEAVAGLHVFSFNNVGPTVAWLDQYLTAPAT
jgi:methylenetetrahydrofolate reductase (NADPH)